MSKELLETTSVLKFEIKELLVPPTPASCTMKFLLHHLGLRVPKAPGNDNGVVTDSRKSSEKHVNKLADLVLHLSAKSSFFGHMLTKRMNES